MELLHFASPPPPAKETYFFFSVFCFMVLTSAFYFMNVCKSLWLSGKNDSFFFFLESLSRVQLFVTPWTIQSMEFSRPEYWSGDFLLQGIFPTQRSNPGLSRYRQILDQLSHKGSPRFYFKGFFTYVVILADLVFSLLKLFLENSVYSVTCTDSKYTWWIFTHVWTQVTNRWSR